MALIVGKRRMSDVRLSSETAPTPVLINPQPAKKWCSSETHQDKLALIAIPQTPIEKLKIAFPTIEDKVSA